MSLDPFFCQYLSPHFNGELPDLGKDVRIVKVNKSNGEIILNTAARPMRSKTGRMYIKNIELVYQVAKHIAKTSEERDVLFSKIIKKVFDKLI